MSSVFSALGWLMFGLNITVMLVVFVLAVVGAVQVATTRDDAFMVVDRLKQNWLLLLGGAALLAALPLFVGVAMQMLWIIAAVIVGIYWQDVRPSIRDVLGNSGGVW